MNTEMIPKQIKKMPQIATKSYVVSQFIKDSLLHVMLFNKVIATYPDITVTGCVFLLNAANQQKRTVLRCSGKWWKWMVLLKALSL